MIIGERGVDVLSENRTGIEKYGKYISDKECNSKEFNRHFKFPRSVKDNSDSFNTMDVVVAVFCMSFGTTLFDNEVETPPISIDLITELALRRVDSRNRTKVSESLKKLNQSDVFTVEMISKNLFTVKADVSHGYVKYNYNDLDKIKSIQTVSAMNKALHVFTMIIVNIFGTTGVHDDDEKFVCYRSHKTIGDMCGMSRSSTSRSLELLDEVEALCSYNVQLSGVGVMRKSIRSRYQDRDMLRRYVETRLGQAYVRVIDGKEMENNE